MNDNTIVTEKINEGSPQKENKMDNEKLNKLATIAVEDIKRAHSRLDEIRDACRHKEENRQVELISGTLQVTCKTCYAILGLPSTQEIRDAGYTI